MTRKQFDFLFFEIKMSEDDNILFDTMTNFNLRELWTHIIALPFELIVNIGAVDPCAWRTMLAIPSFAQWTLTKHSRRMRRLFLAQMSTATCAKHYFRGRLHNFDDLPAVTWTAPSDELVCIFPNEQQTKSEGSAWFRNGYLHRDGDKPALIYDGIQEWYQNGKNNRTTNGPTFVNKKVIRWDIRDSDTFVAYIQPHRIWYVTEINEDGDHETIECEKISEDYFNELFNYYSTSWK